MFEAGKVYSTKEVADTLRINRRTVVDWVHTGLVRNVCPGAIIRIPGEDLLRATTTLPPKESRGDRKARGKAAINRIKSMKA